MTTTMKWKIAVLFVLVLFSGVTLLPSFYDEDKVKETGQNMPEWWKNYLINGGLRQGLDLQGGMHLVLKVDLKKAMENNLDFKERDLKDTLAENGISVVRTESKNPQKAVFILPNIGARDTVKEIVKRDFADEFDFRELEVASGSFPRFELSLTTKQKEFINKNAVDQSLEIIRNRIDLFGVAEPVIVKQGVDEIVVQLPGIKDRKRAMELIKSTAQLEFKLVDDISGLNLWSLVGEAKTSGQWRSDDKDPDNRKKLNQVLRHKLPANTEVYFEKQVDPQTNLVTEIPLLIKSPVLMTGEMIKTAQPRPGDGFSGANVDIELTSHGGRVFGQITEKNVNKRLAIILDGVVRSAPNINQKILGGKAQITGNFTFEEARDLAIVLRVGALPAPISIIQNLTVDASLGKDSIDKGLMSGLLGTALVLLFMIVYYRLSGVIANFALLLNVLLLFAGLAAMQATLTLPGIAGIILSIGMAVDSNVLIFERMREEFALGKSVKSGVEGGYDKALWTIVDSQVTTLITALALFLFGTGPIKGFAVTLSLGVTFNLFTTLFGTRLVYDVLHSKRWLKPLNFLKVLTKPDIDYMKIRNYTFTASAVLVMIGLLAFVQIWRGQANMGVDFTGGTLLQYQASQPFALEEVRKVLDTSDLAGIDPQKASDNRLIVKLKKSEEEVGKVGERVTTLLNEQMADKQFKIESRSEIGSSISEILRNKALLAIGISLFGVICYLGLRFDLRFGLAAAIATFHDVLVVLGICYLLDIEITLLIVTALLTLAGYSLNDSVVVFDRIREHLKKYGRTMGFAALINKSINDVLSRTIVTSMTSAMVLVALYLLGGSVIHDFSLALLSGLMVGTYSSIFIASPLLYLWRGETEAD